MKKYTFFGKAIGATSLKVAISTPQFKYKQQTKNPQAESKWRISQNLRLENRFRMSSVKQLLLQKSNSKVVKSNFNTSVFITEGRGLFIGKKSWFRGEINWKNFDLLSPFPRPTVKEIIRSIKKGEKGTMIWSIRLLGLWVLLGSWTRVLVS